MNGQEVARRVAEFEELVWDVQRAEQGLLQKCREAKHAAHIYKDADLLAAFPKAYGHQPAEYWREGAKRDLGPAIEQAAEDVEALLCLVQDMRHAVANLRVAARGVDTRGE